jgi:phage-related protein
MKPIEFHGHSLETIRKFPLTVKREIGYQLDRLQRGLNPVDWKPMPTIGKGVKEIRIHRQGQYRVIFVTNVGDSILVLHAFQKKAGKTARMDINQAQNALKRAIKRQE